MLRTVNWSARALGLAWVGVAAFAILPPRAPFALPVQIAAYALLGLGLAALDPVGLEHRRALTDLSAAQKQAIDELVADRTQARKERDWARADQIRAQLDELGVQLTDTPDGSTWQLR